MLERAGDLLATDVLAGHRWYEEGAEDLLARQDASGAWTKQDVHRPCDLINTCMALLFLSRSTPPVLGE